METQNDTEPQTGMTIYLLCEDCEDSWGNFTILAWSHDKDLLTDECIRLENEKYQRERKLWDESGGDPNFGPIAPGNRQNGYMQYYVKDVGQWPTPNNGLANKNERLVIPPEVLDLVRFMCATWADIDKWAYENMSSDALAKYPVIQGTRNQINLQRIGEQDHTHANIDKAVKWLMEN